MFMPNAVKILPCLAVLAWAIPAMAQSQPQANDLTKAVASCLQQAKAALAGSPQDAAKIDAYAANSKIYFNNPFVSQNPTFAFWKCLRLGGFIE